MNNKEDDYCKLVIICYLQENVLPPTKKNEALAPPVMEVLCYSALNAVVWKCATEYYLISTLDCHMVLSRNNLLSHRGKSPVIFRVEATHLCYIVTTPHFRKLSGDFWKATKLFQCYWGERQRKTVQSVRRHHINCIINLLTFNHRANLFSKNSKIRLLQNFNYCAPHWRLHAFPLQPP